MKFTIPSITISIPTDLNQLTAKAKAAIPNNLDQLKQKTIEATNKTKAAIHKATAPK